MLNNSAFRFSYNKQLPANILNQNRISDRRGLHYYLKS